MRRFAASHHLDHLTRLTIRDTDLGPEGAAALAGSPHLAGLTHLTLRNTALRVDGVRALAAGTHFSSEMAIEVDGFGRGRFADFRD